MAEAESEIKFAAMILSGRRGCLRRENQAKSQELIANSSCSDLSVILPRGIHPFPSRTRKLSPAGPMVLHAPSVWESFRQAQDKLRSLPALIKASLRNQIGLFLCRECGAGALARERPGTNPCGRFFSSWTQVPQAFAGEGARAT